MKRNHQPYILRFPTDPTPAFCHKCEQHKPTTSFYAHSTRSDGAVRYRPLCRDCRVTGPRTLWARPVHTALLEAGVQLCKICLVTKPLGDFYANGCFADGVVKYRSRCKVCVLAKAQQDQPKNYKTKSERRSSSPKAFLSGALNHAAKRKLHLGFDLDLKYLLDLYDSQQGRCALSGVPMTYRAGVGRTSTNISIDRIDSRRGYLRGNVQLVCDLVNRMKQDLQEDELVVWCRNILEHHDESVQDPRLV